LGLSYSSDCGQTYTRLLTLSGNTLATVAAFPDVFDANQSSLWCGSSGFAPCISLNLDSLIGLTQVVFRWEGICNNGNNIYVDNIRIEGESAILAPVGAFNASWDLPACAGSTVHFQNESLGYPSSFSWTFTGGNPTTSSLENPSVVYAEPGLYTVSLTVSNDFGSDTVSITNFIQVLELPTVSISTNNDSICGGNSAQLLASGATYYYWNNGPAMSSTLGDSVNVSPQNNATYTVNGVSNAGCTASASQQIFVVTQPAPPTIVIDGVFLVASPGIAYEWYLNGVLLPNETSQTLLPTQNGNYNVRVYIQENCSSISSIFNVNFAGSELLDGESSVFIFPNPANESVLIKGVDGECSIQIFNYMGQVVFDGKATEIINTSAWGAGTYFLRLTDKKGKFYRNVFDVVH
jgi:PKD repeat protein